jgi:hypothetical protein
VQKDVYSSSFFVACATRIFRRLRRKARVVDGLTPLGASGLLQYPPNGQGKRIDEHRASFTEACIGPNGQAPRIGLPLWRLVTPLRVPT